VLGWEFNLRIELSVVQSLALAFDYGLAKTIKKVLYPSQKRRPNKKGVPAFLH